MVDGLRQREQLDDTLLVVLGTHGEELGEHGDTGSGWTLYDEVLRMPLVMRAPGLIEPGQTEAAASIVDLYPTLLSLAAVPQAENAPALEGRPLFSSRQDGSRPSNDTDREVITELVIPERAILRAVIEVASSTSRPSKTHAPAEREAVAAAYFDIVTAVAKGEAQAQPLWGPPVARPSISPPIPQSATIWRRSRGRRRPAGLRHQPRPSARSSSATSSTARSTGSRHARRGRGARIPCTTRRRWPSRSTALTRRAGSSRVSTSAAWFTMSCRMRAGRILVQQPAAWPAAFISRSSRPALRAE